VRYPGRIAAVVVLLATVIGVLLLQRGVFVLRNLRVEGTARYTSQQVADWAGLRHGQNIFALDQQQIAFNLQGECFLLLESIYVDYPDTLILHVRERAPRAALSRNGFFVLVDEINVVLGVDGTLDPALQVPVVTGMDVLGDDEGQPVTVKVPAQLMAMNEILKELELQMVTARVSELNVANLDNLYLVTKEGLIVELGDSEQMELKIGMMRAVLERLKDMGVYTGLLDVSVPYTADYLEAREPEYQSAIDAMTVASEPAGR